jgi:ammonium transporter, Amt family
MTSFAITCLVTVLYFVVTYALAFTGGSAFIGGFSRVLLQGIHYDLASGANTPNGLAPTIPETVYMMFQMTFAIITPALIAGSFAERMKFSAMLWFIGLWAIFVYAPVAHWVWGPDGFMSAANVDSKGNFQGFFQVLDFAGGTVVHINAGVAGLVSCLVLGKRKEPGPAHNMVLTYIGAALLWVGWFGFNAGSGVCGGLQAGRAMTVTLIATAVAALTWMFVEWGHRGKPTVVGIASGAVAGLVAITPASGFVGPVGALVIGIACGVGCYLGATALKSAFGYDDALDAFGVHAVGGAIGAILTGVFAVNEFSGHSGLLEGDVGQFINQFKGVATVIVYDAIVTFIILKIVDVAVGLRVSEEVVLFTANLGTAATALALGEALGVLPDRLTEVISRGSGNSFALNALGGDTGGLNRLAGLAGTLLQKDVRLVADLADAGAVPGGAVLDTADATLTLMKHPR